jgi:XRE family transcriptional regulator, fatty acid utilization regulator
MKRTEPPQGSQDGDKIRKLREDAGLTVAELAARVGIGAPSLSNIELGVRPASLAVLIRIARELGKRLDVLVKVAA